MNQVTTEHVTRLRSIGPGGHIRSNGSVDALDHALDQVVCSYEEIDWSEWTDQDVLDFINQRSETYANYKQLTKELI